MYYAILRLALIHTFLQTPISDLIVIWRAWAIYQDKKWVLILPCLLWLGLMGKSQFEPS
jgi:hypothetical protein